MTIQDLKTKAGINPRKSKSLWLQGIGDTCGVYAKELVKGDMTIWNFGHTNEVVSVTPSKSGKTVTVVLRYKDVRDEWQESPRKLKADRVVGVEFDGHQIGTNRNFDESQFNSKVHRIINKK